MDLAHYFQQSTGHIEDRPQGDGTREVEASHCPDDPAKQGGADGVQP